MAEFTAKDVQALRQATGAGMMDAKEALEESGGDAEAAALRLRERGLGKAAARGERENEEGAVAIAHGDGAMAIVELKSETDFVAKSDEFGEMLDRLADRVATEGEDAIARESEAVDELRIRLKENVEVGRVVRFEQADDTLIDSYLHIQNDRGVNAVLVETSGGTAELAHDVAVHIAFARPAFLTRDEVPAAAVDAERETLADITRKEGKPEQAWDKIVEGRLTGWYRERVLVDQKYARDESQTVAELLGDVSIVRYAQVEIGA